MIFLGARQKKGGKLDPHEFNDPLLACQSHVQNIISYVGFITDGEPGIRDI